MKISWVKGVCLADILPQLLICHEGFQTRNVRLTRNSDAIRTHIRSIIFSYISQIRNSIHEHVTFYHDMAKKGGGAHRMEKKNQLVHKVSRIFQKATVFICKKDAILKGIR